MTWLIDRFIRNQELLPVSESAPQAVNHAGNQALDGEAPALASIDDLTQIPDRLCFNEFIEQEWQRAMQKQHPICVILCDIDYFEKFNNHYGPLQGDNCLMQVAQAIYRSARRSGDLVARYGGEAFVMVLPNTPLEGGVFVAREAQAEVRRLQIAHATSLVGAYVSVSVGVASMLPAADTQSRILMAEVDRQLLCAKQQGRNRIACEVETLLTRPHPTTSSLRATDPSAATFPAKRQ